MSKHKAYPRATRPARGLAIRRRIGVAVVLLAAAAGPSAAGWAGRAAAATAFVAEVPVGVPTPVRTPAPDGGATPGTSRTVWVKPRPNTPLPTAGEVLDQVNRLRTDPAGYADVLSGLRGRYQGRWLRWPGRPVPLRMPEDAGALDEAILALRHTAPVPPLRLAPGLSLAAGELARAQARTGAVGHGGDLAGRINRQGRWRGVAGEVIDYGGWTAAQIVFDLVVDAGVPRRGHRRNLLDARFRRVGIACADHPRHRRVCVVDLASGFEERALTSRTGPPTAVLPPSPLAAVSFDVCGANRRGREGSTLSGPNWIGRTRPLAIGALLRMSSSEG